MAPSKDENLQRITTNRQKINSAFVLAVCFPCFISLQLVLETNLFTVSRRFNASRASGEVRDEERHNRSHICAQCGTSSEAEPSNPKEDGAHNNVGDVIRAEVKLLSAMSFPLAEHIRVCEDGTSGCNMHRSSARKIESTHQKYPTVWIPGPVSNRIVDNSRPNKHENRGG